jgi:hypothetical protein
MFVAYYYYYFVVWYWKTRYNKRNRKGKTYEICLSLKIKAPAKKQRNSDIIWCVALKELKKLGENARTYLVLVVWIIYCSEF